MRTAIFWLCLLILLPTGTALALEASESPNAHPLPVGSTMPDLQLMGKISPELLATLGLQGNEPYPLSNIKAKTIILVAFSMYCPHCQREAPDARVGAAGRGRAAESAEHSEPSKRSCRPGAPCD